MRMRGRNPEISLMPEFDSEEAFNASFAKEAAAVAPYRDSQGRLVLDDIHDLPKVVEKVFLDIAKSDYIPYAYLYDIAEKQWFACDTCQDCGFALLNENYLQTHV